MAAKHMVTKIFDVDTKGPPNTWSRKYLTNKKGAKHVFTKIFDEKCFLAIL